MQFHYVIGYDTDTRKWFIDGDQYSYLPDGNVWTNENGGFWDIPHEDNGSDIIDERCWNMLNALVTIWPEVDHGY